MVKNRLSEYLRRVQAGERVVVTNRGRPIADLGPIGRRRRTPDDRLRLLVESGEVTLGKGGALPEFEPIAMRGRLLSQTILDDRD